MGWDNLDTIFLGFGVVLLTASGVDCAKNLNEINKTLKEQTVAQRRYLVDVRNEQRVGDPREDLVLTYSDGAERIFESCTDLKGNEGYRLFEQKP